MPIPISVSVVWPACIIVCWRRDFVRRAIVCRNTRSLDGDTDSEQHLMQSDHEDTRRIHDSA